MTPMNDYIALGKQEVEMAVYAKVAAHETLRQAGVARLNAGFSEKFGMSKTPGVQTRLEEDGSLHIDISIIVHYGTDLRELGPKIQESVLSGIRKLSDQPVGQINVYVADIDFEGVARRSDTALPAPTEER
jgi:uncharacterized alkaline shock family protein YloU